MEGKLFPSSSCPVGSRSVRRKSTLSRWLLGDQRKYRERARTGMGLSQYMHMEAGIPPPGWPP